LSPGAGWYRAEYMIQEFEQIRVLIAYDGVVHWEPGGVFMTTCDIHILYFPFDMQACQIELGISTATIYYARRQLRLTKYAHN